MSEISRFRIQFILPKIMGKLVNQLQSSVESLLTPRNPQLYWHTLGERELKLKQTYLGIRAQSKPLGLEESSPNHLDTLAQHHIHLKAMVTALKQVPVMAMSLKPDPHWAECQRAIKAIGQAVTGQNTSPEILDLARKTDARIRETDVKYPLHPRPGGTECGGQSHSRNAQIIGLSA